jgi:hypothetical protein
MGKKQERRINTIKRLRVAVGVAGKEKNVLNDEEVEKLIAKYILHFRRASPDPEKRTSYRKIANRLNSEGIPARGGKSWTAQEVYNVVNSRFL